MATRDIIAYTKLPAWLRYINYVRIKSPHEIPMMPVCTLCCFYSNCNMLRLRICQLTRQRELVSDRPAHHGSHYCTYEYLAIELNINLSLIVTLSIYVKALVHNCMIDINISPGPHAFYRNSILADGILNELNSCIGQWLHTFSQTSHMLLTLTVARHDNSHPSSHILQEFHTR